MSLENILYVQFQTQSSNANNTLGCIVVFN